MTFILALSCYSHICFEFGVLSTDKRMVKEMSFMSSCVRRMQTEGLVKQQCMELYGSQPIAKAGGAD